MIVMTNNLEVFNVARWQAQDVDDLSNYSNVSGSEGDILRYGMGLGSVEGISITAILAGAVVLAGAAGLAWLCRSPVPLGVGAFAALYTSLFAQTYSVLQQFPINTWLLGAGTAGLGIMAIITAIEMMTGGHTT